MVTDYQRMLDAKLRYVDLHKVNVEYVLPCGMLANWRRRTKRLERAKSRTALDTTLPVAARFRRLLAIDAACRRLYTGRLN